MSSSSSWQTSGPSTSTSESKAYGENHGYGIGALIGSIFGGALGGMTFTLIVGYIIYIKKLYQKGDLPAVSEITSFSRIMGRDRYIF